MLKVLEERLAAYRTNEGEAGALLGVGFSPIGDKIDRNELAAWTHVARILLNLHETITRE